MGEWVAATVELRHALPLLTQCGEPIRGPLEGRGVRKRLSVAGDRILSARRDGAAVGNTRLIEHKSDAALLFRGRALCDEECQQ